MPTAGRLRACMHDSACCTPTLSDHLAAPLLASPPRPAPRPLPAPCPCPAGVAGVPGDCRRAGRHLPRGGGRGLPLLRRPHADTAHQPAVGGGAPQHQAPDPVSLWRHRAGNRGQIRGAGAGGWGAVLYCRGALHCTGGQFRLCRARSRPVPTHPQNTLAHPRPSPPAPAPCPARVPHCPACRSTCSTWWACCRARCS